MCDFPSKELKAERRRIANLADEEVDHARVELCAQFLLRCDQLRLLHEEITGCPCWHKEAR